MFEKASRLKLRFNTPVGILSIEDLWDLPLLAKSNQASLDDLAKSLNQAVRESEEESFVVVKTKTDTELALAFDIVKHIIKVKLEEQKIRDDQVAAQAQKKRLLELIDKKKNEKLEGKSLEELIEMAEQI